MNYILPNNIDFFKEINDISIDQNIDPLWALNNIKFKNNRKLCIQGNLNPETLLKKKKDILNQVNDIMETFGDINHVFNLGHGIIKTTPIDNVKFLIDTIKKWKK